MLQIKKFHYVRGYYLYTFTSISKSYHCTHYMKAREETKERGDTWKKNYILLSPGGACILHWRHPPLRRFFYTHSGHINIHKGVHKKWWTIVSPNVKGPSISITFLSIIWWDKGCFILDTFKKQLLPLIISKVKIQTQYIWVISGFRKQHVSYLQILLEHIYGDAVSHFNGAFSSKRF